MTLRCLLLSDTTAIGSDAGLSARLSATPGIEVVTHSIAADPAILPPCDFVLLHLSRDRSLADLRRTLAELGRGGKSPLLTICARSLAHQAQVIAHSDARDFLFEPFSDEELRARLQRALGVSTVSQLSAGLISTEWRIARNLVGGSRRFLDQVEQMTRYAKCSSSVLIHGETGTGKEVFARALHYTSNRAAAPWIAINCGAIPGELIEDELFGHVRGAYTTAVSNRNGLVKEAEGGSLFLDDIDCLPLAAQTKLLRFLQEREFRAVGSNTVQHANVRVITASNRNLEELIATDRFRQDLYYRLNVLPLHIPPLRERREDVPALARHFVRQFAREFGRPVQSVALAAMHRLMQHDWPGNVRELQHVIERAVVLTDGRVLNAADLDCGHGGAPTEPEVSFRAMKARVVEQFERGYIEHLLETSGGNVTQAARVAGKNRRAFFELMRKYRIASEPYRTPSV